MSTENQELEDSIISAAIRDGFYSGRTLKSVEGKMVGIPVSGISRFEMATFMAMQGLASRYGTDNRIMNCVDVASIALRMAKETIMAVEIEKERLFPVNLNTDDDLPF